jgi:hypothetical protein
MFRMAAAPILAAVLAVPLAASADPPRAEGRSDSDEGHVEILGRPVRVGERVDLPEGWIRVEEKGTEDRDVGSFSVVAAGALAGAGEAASSEIAEAGGMAPASAREPDCRAERAAYLAELWKQSGIEVSSPEAVLEGLDSGHGAAAGFYWLALATDPFRPLAWSSDLRARAEALARCVKGLTPR